MAPTKKLHHFSGTKMCKLFIFQEPIFVFFRLKILSDYASSLSVQNFRSEADFSEYKRTNARHRKSFEFYKDRKQVNKSQSNKNYCGLVILLSTSSCHYISDTSSPPSYYFIFAQLFQHTYCLEWHLYHQKQTRTAKSSSIDRRTLKKKSF